MYIIYSSIPNFPIDQTGFATNIVRPGEDGKPLYQLALIIEVVMTTLLCLAVLATTRKDFPKISIPILLGVVLALVHLISMPITNTSVNPARSIGVAVFIKESWTYLWVFILAPIVGAAIASLIHRAVLDDAKKEELTLQADVPSDEGARKD